MLGIFLAVIHKYIILTERATSTVLSQSRFPEFCFLVKAVLFLLSDSLSSDFLYQFYQCSHMSVLLLREALMWAVN